MKIKLIIFILLFKTITQTGADTSKSRIKNEDILNENNSLTVLNMNSDTMLLYTLNSWAENKNNLKNLIFMIIKNNFENLIDCDLALCFSNLYQLLLFKKTLFSSKALEILLKDCKNKLIYDLKYIETTLISNISPCLILLENELIKFTKDKWDEESIIDYINHIVLNKNMFNEFHFQLKKYIVNCRINIARNKIYSIPINIENIKGILARYNVFISSMIDIYCRTMLAYKSELFMKAIYQCKKENKSELKNYKLFLDKIGTFKGELRDFYSLLHYNVNRYNNFINSQIAEIKELFDDQICPIESNILTNFAKEILFDIDIIKTEKTSKFNTDNVLYYLSNPDSKNCIGFEETKNSMLKCCKEEFPELKTLNFNLNNFKSYKSALNHIKIKIKINLILKKDEKTDSFVLFCSYKLIPTIIQDINFSINFNKHLQDICNQIKKAGKDITINYEKHLENKKNHWELITIIGEKKNFIYKNSLKEQGIKEYLTIGLTCLKNTDIDGNLEIKRIDLEVKAIFYRYKTDFDFYELLATRSRTLCLYPITESVQESVNKNNDGNIKFYFFESYIYNPKIVELKKKTYLLYDFVLEFYNNTKFTKKLQLITSGFINDWFETSIAYSNAIDGFFDVVPYKYVSSWMAYITFRYISKNINLIMGEKAKLNQNIIDLLYNVIKKYEIYSFAFDPFYNIPLVNFEETVLKTDNSNIHYFYWSDEINSENNEKLAKTISKILPANKKYNFLFYKFVLIFNQQVIGDGNINVTRIDSCVTRTKNIQELWYMLYKQCKIVCNTTRREDHLNQLRHLVKNL